MRTSVVIPLAVLIGGIVIAIATYQVTPRGTSIQARLDHIRPVSAQDHILGNPAASVKIIEYVDFDCSYCKTLDENMRQIVATEGADGKVAWVYREFPLTSQHPDALAAAEAAECASVAGGNDAFWKFTQLLFADQPVDPLHYGALASQLSIPAIPFASCFSHASSTVLERIHADIADGKTVGITGVPFSVLLVDGKPSQALPGTYPYVALRQIITTVLTGLKK